MLQIHNISKRYRSGTWALKEFSLEISNGVLGLIGPNGAGKTTLLKIISTLLLPTEGTIVWKGVDIIQSPISLRKNLGYLPQEFGVYPQLTANEFLHYIAAAKGLTYKQATLKIEELLELVHLTDVQHETLAHFSGGMKQRIGIAQSLLNDPELLIVDEPTVGLDPEERSKFRTLIGSLSSSKNIILSTHIISDIETSASHLAILHKGKLLLHTTTNEILQKMRGMVFEGKIGSDHFHQIQKDYLVVSSRMTNDITHFRYIVENKIPLHDSTVSSPNLEDAYLYMLSVYSEGKVNDRF